MARETRLSMPNIELFYHDEESNTWKPLAVDGAIPVVIAGGETGTGGNGGMRFLNGTGVPAEDNGMEGDVYLNTQNGDMYKKASSKWNLLMNLKGVKGDTGNQGPKGDKGDKGDTGTAGPKGDTGATGPAGPTGPKGDKGDKGDTGSVGPQGPAGPAGPQGPKGADGFGTQAQYNDIIARLTALETPEA